MRNHGLPILSNLVTFALVFLAGPIVFAGFWWRYWPAHEWQNTLVIGVALSFSIYIMFTSLNRVSARLLDARPNLRIGMNITQLAGLLALVTTTGLMKTENFAQVENSDPPRYTLLGWPVPSFFNNSAQEVMKELASADLSEVEFIPKPADWRDYDDHKRNFRKSWCKAEGLKPAVCGPVPNSGTPPPHQTKARDNWAKEFELAEQDKAKFFANLETRFKHAWKVERTATIEALPNLNLRNKDLRRAQAFFSFLPGVDLRKTQLEGAIFIVARLEGANLSAARLEGANLRRARLEGADLSSARLEGADLSSARLEGANLVSTRLEKANLSRARLEGADLSAARLEGANLSGARLEGANLFSARLEGANLFSARMERANLVSTRLEGANLFSARMEGANLRRARLEGADLSNARLEGADLRRANLKSVEWAGGNNPFFPAHSTDFRGGVDLKQAMLENAIGNEGTKLPDTKTTEMGEPFYIWSCWETPPESFETITNVTYGWTIAPRLSAADAFLCQHRPRVKTGTPMALDAKE